MSVICPTSPDVGQCAEAICDQHLSAQLKSVADTLAYALYAHGITSSDYGEIKGADTTVGSWAAEDWENFLWLSFYGLALAEESDIRFGDLTPSVAQVISSGQVGMLMSDSDIQDWNSPQYWFNIANLNKEPGRDLFESHRKYVLKGYAKMAEDGSPPTWTGVNPPLWVMKHAR